MFIRNFSDVYNVVLLRIRHRLLKLEHMMRVKFAVVETRPFCRRPSVKRSRGATRETPQEPS